MRDTLKAVLARIDALQAELNELRATVSSGAFDTADDSTAPAPPSDGAATSRRGLLRYGALALGAAAATLTAKPAEAADGDPMLIGQQNVGTSGTTLTNDAGGFALLVGAANGDAIIANATNPFGFGILGIGGVRGVGGIATSPGSTGVLGLAEDSLSGTKGVLGVVNSPFGIAIHGQNNAGGGAAVGIRGETTSPAGFGVYGVQSGGVGVMGEIPATTDRSGIALYGLNNSSYAGPGPGAGGFGVYGLSARGHGLVGATAAAGAAAVVGATNGVAGAYAAAFYGPVVATGSLTVFGAKSAAVPHPDGSRRRVYCVESPESWFEDFGEATLECGEAAIALDPDFAAIVDTAKYHVFLTGYDGRSDLSVTARTATGFRVKASAENVGGTFSWRVVAKRADIRGSRLETVTIPDEPELPNVAPVNTPPVTSLPALPREVGRRR